jgi:hypothetical protein
MKVKVEVKGLKFFYYAELDLKADEILDLIDAGWTVTCAETKRLITRMTLGNVVYMDKVQPKA